jgi:hypothetical protein
MTDPDTPTHPDLPKVHPEAITLSPPPPDKRCGNCLMWDRRDTGLSHYPCAAIGQITAHPTQLKLSENIDQLPAFLRTEHRWWVDASVYTRADFSCALWEQKQ